MTRSLKLVQPQSETEKKHPALVIRKLSKIFPGAGRHLNVLNDLTFSVSPGELVCILGPSGCGKTTLLNLIAGFLKPSSGNIYINGREVKKPGSDRCVIFQEDSLFPWLTVEENIAFGARKIMSKKQRTMEVKRYLELVGLRAFKDYLPREISGGMKQRVALARVLILKPQVLLMDEPFGALDAQTREDMQNLLLSLWKELAHTIVFITHDLNEAITLSDRILVMGHHPGSIRAEIPVSLARPRKKESDAFHRFYQHLHGRL